MAVAKQTNTSSVKESESVKEIVVEQQEVVPEQKAVEQNNAGVFKVFSFGDQMPGMKKAAKKPTVIFAKPIYEDFIVNNKDGKTTLVGKPGDYLLKDKDGNFSVCDRNTFMKDYSFLK